MVYKAWYYLLLFLTFPFYFQPMDLFSLVKSHDVKTLSECITGSSDVMQCDAEGNTLLHFVRTPEMARYLLSCGAQVNAVNSANDTPLHTIMWNGSHDDPTTVIELLDHGADMALINNNHKNSVHHAVAKSSSFLVRFLSRVPRYRLYEALRKQQAAGAYTQLLCFKHFKQVQLPSIPGDVQKMLIKYCKRPPYLFYNEQDAVHSLLFEKLDTLCNVLVAQDAFLQSPGDIELRIMPVLREKLLDSFQVKQYSKLIIASIGEVIDLKLSYLAVGPQLTIPRVLLAEPLPLYQDLE